MISFQIALQSVQLPLFITKYKFVINSGQKVSIFNSSKLDQFNDA